MIATVRSGLGCSARYAAVSTCAATPIANREMTTHYHFVAQTPYANLSKGCVSSTVSTPKRPWSSFRHPYHVGPPPSRRRRLPLYSAVRGGTPERPSLLRRRSVGASGGEAESLAEEDSACAALRPSDTQTTNRRHGLVGHLFQGPFKAILVERDAYLLELARGPWSGYRAMIGQRPAPAWLATDWLLDQFGQERSRAQAGYAAFVRQGIGQPNVWERLRHQMFLGSEAFVKRHCAPSKRPERLQEVPRADLRARIVLRRPFGPSRRMRECKTPLRNLG
jgi:hypothetical protein